MKPNTEGKVRPPVLKCNYILTLYSLETGKLLFVYGFEEERKYKRKEGPKLLVPTRVVF